MKNSRRTAWLSLLLLLCLLITGYCVAVPVIRLNEAFRPPGDGYLLGSTPLGQSVAILALTGAGTTVTLSAGALCISLGFALLLAGLLYLVPRPAARAYASVIDAWLAIPGIFIALSIGYFLPQSPLSVMTALVLSEFAPLQKFLLQRLGGIGSADYITMAKVMGAPPGHTLRHHVMPRLARETGYLFAVTLPSMALSLASLEFLGVQTGSERMSLGLQIAVYKDYIVLYPYLSLVPVAMLLGTLFLLNAAAGLVRPAEA